MKKNFVQDVIPPKKSIRNVTLPSRPTKKIDRSESSYEEFPKAPPKKIEQAEDFSRPVAIKQNPIKIDPTIGARSSFVEEEVNPKYAYEYETPKKRFPKSKYVAFGVLFLALAFGVSTFFKGAEIRINPKQDVKTLNSSFSARKDVTSTTELAFQVVTVFKDAEKTVEATGEEMVEKKATGKIVIYNNYSTQPQKLIATTRFETPEGLVFRLVKDTTVPGRETIAGKTIAGSIEADVIADKSGTNYNIGMKDFAIPGFKGTPRYTGFYARSKTEMSGGFSGMQKIVSKEVMESAEVELEASLRDALSKEINTQIPANFVTYEKALFYKSEAVSQVSGGTGSVVLRKKGTASAVIFDKGALSRAIIAKVSPELSNELIKITNLEALQFSFPENTTFNPEASALANFDLKGDVNLVWIFDENKLKTDLLGLSKKNARTVIETYGNIKEAWIETRPFWNQSIPKDPSKVTLVNVLEQ